jgi:hypothetical protein
METTLPCQASVLVYFIQGEMIGLVKIGRARRAMTPPER